MNPRRVLLATLVLACLAPLPLRGDAAARKNREGNRLYGEGKYAEAERAYLEAQVKAPGRAELLYNHGNALIRQKKYEPALQQLRQAIGKGNRGLQASAWFNSGNALYEMGRFTDAAAAYIQALKIDPADRGAKHNLELALRQIQESRQGAAEAGRQNGQEREDSRTPAQPDAQNPPPYSRAAGSPQKQQRSRAPEAQPPSPEPRDDGMGRDQALRILDALQNQELTERKKRLEDLARRKAAGKDW